MKFKLFTILILLISISAFNIKAQEKTFFLGHSLVNFNMPNMVNKLSIAGNKNFNYQLHIGNGANILFHWQNPYSAGAQGNIWDTTLAQGNFDNFIFTEAVPLKGHLQWSNTYRIADSFYRYAKQYSPNVKVYLYETWHCINSGLAAGCDWDNDDHIPWRQRLNLDLPLWEGIADSVNNIHNDDMLIIPAGQALATLFDSIQGGNVPGITAISQVFSDDIHLLNLGNYYIACVFYAVLHGESPLGLPNQLTDEWSVPYSSFPTTAQAEVFQRLAWQTVCAYQRDGVSCLPSSTINFESKHQRFCFPNPSTGKFNLNLNEESKIEIWNTLGQLIYNNNQLKNGSFDLEKQGVYYLKISNTQGIYNEKLVVQ